MGNIFLIMFAAILTENFIFSRFLGICPFLGVSKKFDQASGMGIAVIFVMLLATAVTWPIQHFLLDAYGLAGALRGAKFLDAMTVYKDRRPYPHRLADAVEAYSLSARNTHRAIDDTRATCELLCAMDAEEADLDRYVNLFGYNEKYGVTGKRISSVTYRPQGFDAVGKLYEE